MSPPISLEDAAGGVFLGDGERRATVCAAPCSERERTECRPLLRDGPEPLSTPLAPPRPQRDPQLVSEQLRLTSASTSKVFCQCGDIMATWRRRDVQFRIEKGEKKKDASEAATKSNEDRSRDIRSGVVA